MMLEFPDDPVCLHLERQYMLGPSLLVAPVFSEEGHVEYYLPEGDWVHLITGERKSGGRFIRETLGFLDIPVYQRPDTILALGAVRQRPDYDYGEGVELRVHDLPEGQRRDIAIVDTRGGIDRQFSAVREGDSVTVTADDSPKSWKVRVFEKMEVTRGRAQDFTGPGALVIPDGKTVAYRLG